MREENKDWLIEEKRIDFIQAVIKTKSEKLISSVQKVKDKVLELRKTFWEDVTVNIEEMDDFIETEASIKQQAELLSERERSHGKLSEQLKTLERLSDSPYFGRIDFHEDNEKETDRIYIGIASLMDEKDENFLIYDWRAPISSLYYDYPPGPAQYHTMSGTIKGEMKLKRQFIIRGGKMNGMFDTGLTIGDHLLQKVLGSNASTTMKNIVATIQKEQNQIIRNEQAKLLIVQGVAGSGKTSAALQRVAYLLYRYRESLSSENIMLFSPNPLFNSYIATVLPELGEENMKQATFQEHVEERLGKHYSIETPFEQMEYYLTGQHTDSYQTRVSSIRFKASPSFKHIMDDYIRDLSHSGIQFRNVNFRGKRLISKEEIYDYFYSLEANVTIPNRMEYMKEWLLEKLSLFEKDELDKDWVLEEANLMEKDDYVKAFEKLSTNKSFSEETFDDFNREERLLRKIVVKRRFKPLRRKVENLVFINVKATYIRLFQQWSLERSQSDLPKEWEDICRQTIDYIENKKLLNEDVASYLYLEDKLLGVTVNRMIRHVFIDEAQDYSPFQFEYIKEMYPYSRVTLLGDYNQAIYAHTFEAGTILNSAANGGKVERITLTNSYRSTKEIVEFTKDIIENGEVIKPFNRPGTLPELKIVNDDHTRIKQIVDSIKQLQGQEYSTIAVICKTMEESNLVYEELSKELPVKLVGPDTKTFQKGILIIPTYLAKGIEFDVVIIPDASEKMYKEEFERNLFYTACTRAMHELLMFSVGSESRFIQQVDLKKYTKRAIN